MRKSDLELPRHPRIAPLLGLLGRIPQLGATSRPAHWYTVELRGQEDLRMHHVAATAVIVPFAAAFVADALTGTVSGGGGGAATHAALDRADMQLKDGHPSGPAAQLHAQPFRRRSRLQIAGEIGQLLEFGGEHCRLDDMLLTDAAGAARTPRGKPVLQVAAARGLFAHHFSLTDEPGGELGSAAVLARRTTEDESGSAVFHDRVGFTAAVEAGYLGDRLQAQDAAAAEFSQARQRILESVDGPERVELIDDEPQSLIPWRATHRLENTQPYPRSDNRAQGGDLGGPVRDEQHPAPRAHPLPDRKRGCALRLQVLERRRRGARHRTYRAEHARVLRLEKGLRRGARDECTQLRVAGGRDKPPQLARVAAAGLAAAPRNGGQEGARVAAPLTAGSVVAGRDQAAHELFDIPRLANLTKRVPLH